MAFEVINVHVAGENPTQTKDQVKKDADSLHLSVSAFMMLCYQEWKKRNSSSKSKK
jgi:hypothetical protein